MTKIEVEDAGAKAPEVTSIAIADAMIGVGVDVLEVHVGDGPNGGVARVHGLARIWLILQLMIFIAV